ncbi:hypothetical protein K3495_g12488 [Podosphaera aphanis]|nr:hypothetical protein K3495_g12488 [Podosphaera aphanis]
MLEFKVIQWSRIAWEGLEARKIQRCWWKSTLIPRPESRESSDSSPDDYTTESEELSGQLNRFFEDPTPIHDFLCPVGEIIVEENDDIFESIVNRYSTIDVGSDRDESEYEVSIEEIRPSISEASKALDTLRPIVSPGNNRGKSQFSKL